MPAIVPAATLPLFRAFSAPGHPTDPAALRRSAQAFEAQALGALLQPMFAGLDAKGPFGGGSAEAQQWRPMLVDAIGRDLARAGGLGIGDAVLRELTRLAGAASQAPSPTPSTPSAPEETRAP